MADDVNPPPAHELPADLPIPDEGLDEVLRAWSGRGQLLAAIAVIDESDDSQVQRNWSEVDVRRRANRVLFSRIHPHLLLWPAAENEWLEALPADVDRERFISRVPRSGVSWRDTRRRQGWPPVAFSGRSKSRVADELMARTFAWTVDRLVDVLVDAETLEPTAGSLVADRVRVARRVRERPPLSAAVSILPEAVDMRSLSGEGYPWNVLAKVAGELRAAERSLSFLAREVLFPDQDLRPRLFHLAVLGLVLQAARDAGAKIISLAPLSGPRAGPAYRVVDGTERSWDLWFEAGGAWAYYKKESPYSRAILGLSGRASSLSPDISLILPGQRALVVECKYSALADYVGRRGLSQVMAYATEYRTALVPDVTAVVVAPDGVVETATSEITVAGKVGLDAPGGISRVVAQALRAL